ncbi:MAG: hypothetical protein O7C75_11615 [Verrucomicrobia bacterium]|nr:hypothetical protein [Verrucomicrobiota bacterium]
MKSQYFSLPSLAKSLLAAAALLVATQAYGYKRVYIHTDAEEDYLAQRSPDKPESYYFFKGVHFGGYIRDKGLKNTPFIDIAKGMAPHLAKQDYWPAQSKETCDLLLIVSWGTTSPRMHRDISTRLFDDYYDGEYYDNIADRDYDESEFRWYGKQRNSKLLGFYPYIRRDKFTGISPWEEYELRAAMRTERYFIIVTAFDFQELMNNKQWKRVWSTRFNIRSPGISFQNAHLALSKAGADYFGKKSKDLEHQKADLDPVIAEVEIGEIEVLETIDVPKGHGILNSLRIPEYRR